MIQSPFKHLCRVQHLLTAKARLSVTYSTTPCVMMHTCSSTKMPKKDNEYAHWSGRINKYSGDVSTGLWDFQCIAVMECDDDSAGMLGLQAYKA